MGVSAAIVGIELATNYASYKAQKSATAAQNAALAEQRKQARMANMQQRRAEIRAAAQQQAQARAAAAARGVSTSSGLRDTLSTVTTNAGTKVSFLDRMQELNNRAYAYNIQANNQTQKANNILAAGQILSSGLNLYKEKF